MATIDTHEDIRALSWKQPYAELMFHGKIETRTWPTKYRGWVLICTSKQPYGTAQIRNLSGMEQYMRIPAMELKALRTFGQAIGVGKLVDCRPMKPEDADACFVRFDPKFFCHIYEDVQRIVPFPWRGSQGWKVLTPVDKGKIIYYFNDLPF